MTKGSFSSGFHLYTLQWLPSGITFKVDGEIIGSLSPPEGGLAALSGFHGKNPWESGSRMAPFDQKVC